MGRPGWDHRGLPCEPGCCLCQDIALLAQLPVLTPQTGQLLALGAGRAVLSAAFVAIGLTNPVPDRLGSRFELARQLLRCSPRSDQINHLSPEFRRIGSVTLRHSMAPPSQVERCPPNRVNSRPMDRWTIGFAEQHRFPRSLSTLEEAVKC